MISFDLRQDNLPESNKLSDDDGLTPNNSTLNIISDKENVQNGHHFSTINRLFSTSPTKPKSIREDSYKLRYEERLKWKNKRVYYATLTGFTFGIAVLWRFPYQVYTNRGGAFLIIYLLMITVLGIGMYSVEGSLAQNLNVSYLRSWQVINPKLAGLGIASAILALTSSIYCGVVNAWALYIWANSFFSFPYLPWQEGIYHGNYVIGVREYWFKHLLSKATGPFDTNLTHWNWGLILTLIVTWVTTIFFIKYGRMFFRTWSFTAILGAFFYLCFIIRLAFASGSWSGLSMMFTIEDWHDLFSPMIWINAASQVFLSAGIGWGALMNWSSFNGTENVIMHDMMTTLGLNLLMSLISAATVFMAIGVMAHDSRIDFWAVSLAGPGSSHMAYMSALSKMPLSGLWNILYWLYFSFMGVSSLANSIQIVTAPIIESRIVKQADYFKLSCVVCLLVFLSGVIYTIPLGIYLMKVMDFASSCTLLIVCFIEVLATLTWYGVDQLFSLWNPYHNTISMMIILVMVTILTPVSVFMLSILGTIMMVVISFPSSMSKEMNFQIGQYSVVSTGEFVACQYSSDPQTQMYAIDGEESENMNNTVCHNQGICVEGICVCESGWGGNKCNTPLSDNYLFVCPLDCNGYGTCDVNSGICKCESGHYGVACHKGSEDNTGVSTIGLIMGWIHYFIVLIAISMGFLSNKVAKKLSKAINVANSWPYRSKKKKIRRDSLDVLSGTIETLNNEANDKNMTSSNSLKISSGEDIRDSEIPPLSFVSDDDPPKMMNGPFGPDPLIGEDIDPPMALN